jgi:hypothetical protein
MQVVTAVPELKLKDQGYSKGYSSLNEAGTFNAVALSALQVFLSMLPLTIVSAVIYNNNKLQLGCHPVAVVILHVYKI